MPYTYTQRVGEDVLHGIDVSGILAQGDTIKAPFSVVNPGSLAGLTILGANTEVEYIQGQRSEIGEVLLFRVTGGPAAVYELTFTFDTVKGSTRTADAATITIIADAS